MEEKKMIEVTVVDATGNTDYRLSWEDALDLCRKEVEGKKWMYVYGDDDTATHVICSLTEFTEKFEGLKKAILSAKRVAIMAELAGGGEDKFRFDEEGYDAEGYDSEGYDADGYDRDGYDADGYDRDGHTRGFNKERMLAQEAGTSVVIAAKLVRDPQSKAVVTITADEVILNNAFSREQLADAVARFSAVLSKAIPHLMAGTAEMIEPDRKK